ncbi:uncharacterized protein B0I36DRAFT_356181 [Microdochium trichocladiopsis]|uniref:Uncharacterized protein n=1 Tax=Microdochium trichocladiopsis TaxID=1682393 RepID=A0A9P8XQH3_9PEZI|nr:uncharacterized protein B0I36DRAFT_356181 [Microdochium trichocladiopsis]KAH7012083.1 hypothetical protein B0I36DRAFT_356181 [Microdochium trichocladiopsis]
MTVMELTPRSRCANVTMTAVIHEGGVQPKVSFLSPPSLFQDNPKLYCCMTYDCLSLDTRGTGAFWGFEMWRSESLALQASYLPDRQLVPGQSTMSFDGTKALPRYIINRDRFQFMHDLTKRNLEHVKRVVSALKHHALGCKLRAPGTMLTGISGCCKHLQDFALHSVPSSLK